MQELYNVVRNLTQQPIAYHRVFAELGGGAMPALFLSQAFYWTNKTDNEEGWFYKTATQWNTETGMSRSEIETARKRLKERGLILEQKRGVPCRLFYRVNLELIAETLAQKAPYQFAGNQQTGLRKRGKLEGAKPANKAGRKPQTICTETTAETTAETTSIPADAALPDQDPQKPDAKADHKAFIDLWHESYFRQWDREYIFQGGKDGAAVKRLVLTKIPIEDLIGLAKWAWDHIELFNCNHSATIAGFSARINGIFQERDKTKGAKADHENVGWDRDKFFQQLHAPTP
jgi:hypothetical protein